MAAHKLILLSASEVFEKLFHEPIEVPDVEAETFKVLLKYINYKELEELNWANLFDVLYTGK